MTSRWWPLVFGAACVAACGGSTAPLQTADPGVVFTFPIDQQVDVPLGTRIVVAFSDPVVGSGLGGCTGSGATVSGGFCLVGPDGIVEGTAEISADGKAVQIADARLEPGARYAIHVGTQLSPTATNLATGPLFEFTTRSSHARAAPPALIAVNGGDPAAPTAFRPMFETSTLRLVFSEPLDPRGVTLGPGSIELVNMTTSSIVPALVLAHGIHVAIDPVDDLTPGATYQVRLGTRLVDLGGQPLVPTTVAVTPQDTRGAIGPIAQVLRTRQAGDPGPATSRSGGERNVIVMEKPLIGRELSTLLPSALAAELGDPQALGGPMAFTIRRGQRMRASGLAIKLGGAIPVGLSTGDIFIELITDGGGRIYRNPYQPADQRPENERAPLVVDLSLDLAVFTVDPKGNAVITQTVLGVQSVGTAVGTDGVLAIESVASMELGLLGVTEPPTNFVLELITDPAARADADTTAPTLIASAPELGASQHPVDGGIELIFSEPVDLAKLRAGVVRLEQGTTQVQHVLESHGSAVVVRPVGPLAYSTSYRVVLADVADVAGNALASTSSISFTTPTLAGTSAPLTAIAVHPG
ncbi:MAG: Ig-like domain-containing protein, partial [Deltaproteobacteria bacterium]|nr:Ig-like domain-containing protein [Deltaproteobacteria bacterium]